MFLDRLLLVDPGVWVVGGIVAVFFAATAYGLASRRPAQPTFRTPFTDTRKIRSPW